ncbi:hypothetical protein GA0074692_0491 [Micromonospora pallida]|uniref:Uncharacterized protein n=1 Tax=Micromonospora pallida TaxID=145854 RepID=A0A1C6RNV7_9ACTN|nr:hypothetical protein [Micromonospora pallida]SCL18858.1 hypothetical protein GA0074692_0491 [Micromonospora pallida]
MKKFLQRMGVVALTTVAGATLMAGPAQAGVWVDGGLYQTNSDCQTTGHGRVLSGMYQTYTCTAEWDSVAQRNFYRLRGYMN